MMSSATSSVSALVTPNTFPPIAVGCSFSGGPWPCWVSWKPLDRPPASTQHRRYLLARALTEPEALLARFGRLFVRAEPREQAGRYLEGLLGSVRRKNGWQLAEHLGDARPWRTQRVLSHVLWDEEAARDLCRDHVVERLGADDAVLVVDETGFLKKGERSAGVARQYTGTAGRVENA